MTTAEIAKIPPSPTWDIESIFPGGANSPKFKEYRAKVKQEMETTTTLVEALPVSMANDGMQKWADCILRLQTDIENIELILAFAGCLTAQDTKDTDADAAEAEGDLYHSEWQKLMTVLEAKSLELSDDDWKSLVNDSRLAAIKFNVNEIRKIAATKMSVEKEKLALDLAVDGYSAWDRLYNKMSGELAVDFEENGTTTKLSLGQLATKMSDPDRAVRKQAFEKMTEAWESREELAGMTLNSLAGFRLALYKNRGWDSVLKEPLMNARMQQETLDAMWRVIGRETPKLKPYIDAKKKLLSIDKYSWYDEFSPVGKADKLFSFEEAGKFIVENAGKFSTDMAEFFQMALDKRWVEAEDRPNKRGGAFCTGTGPMRETRVFMTYAGNFENLLTLAHELGHAYHGHVLKDRDYFATDYPMNLAETASIFVETLVTDAALAQATDPMEKLMLLEQKIQSAYCMFCDLQSRYLFERSFYEARAKGVVGSKQLRELMVSAQKKSFGNLLDESGYHPMFWASKLHFYITGAPFYNFPYTFGYLFSGGVYDRAQKEGAAFADKYRDLLADTGSMTTEALAKKHLDVDLTKDDFWNDAVARSLADIVEFVKLADSLK